MCLGHKNSLCLEAVELMKAIELLKSFTEPHPILFFGVKFMSVKVCFFFFHRTAR